MKGWAETQQIIPKMEKLRSNMCRLFKDMNTNTKIISEKV